MVTASPPVVFRISDIPKRQMNFCIAHFFAFILAVSSHPICLISSLSSESHEIPDSTMPGTAKALPIKDRRPLLWLRWGKQLNKCHCFQTKLLLQTWRVYFPLSATDRLPTGISNLAFMFHENTCSICLAVSLVYILFCIYAYFTGTAEAWNQTHKE